MYHTYGAQRFPHPEFESGYQVPKTHVDAYLPIMPPLADSILLLLALCVSAALALKTRKRWGIFLLMLFSLAYFGFIRQGCVCPVGSIQNVSEALLTSTGTIPIIVLWFFLLPLIFSLFTGRTFCSSVCPLGGLQDLVIIKPLHLPLWVRETLGLFRYFWLAFTVLLASTGAGYFICRYDPFVGFFRMGMTSSMFLYGMGFLFTGIFIARPYCRFMCPYGVLLGWLSRFSSHHLTTTPGECVECALCPQTCPFDAIDRPYHKMESDSRAKRVIKFKRTIYLSPVILITGLVLGYSLHNPISSLHPRVKLTQQLAMEAKYSLPQTDETKAFRMSGDNLETLKADVVRIKSKVKVGSTIMGLFLALVIISKMLAAASIRPKQGSSPNKSRCFSCGRCIQACPKEHELQALSVDKP